MGERSPPRRVAPRPVRGARRAKGLGETAPVAARVALILRGAQPRLIVGAANDPAEAEADRMAQTALSSRSEGGAKAEPDREARPRRSVMDQPDMDQLNGDPPVPAAQQEIELPAAEDVDTSKLDEAGVDELATAGGDVPDAPEGENAAEAEAPEAEEAEPREAEETAMPLRAAGGEETGGVGRCPAVGPEGGEAPAPIGAAIGAPSPGRPLPAPLRAEMEAGFGRDFSTVRLHDRPADRQTAAAIGARAFAYGHDIWLGEGERAEDRLLIAHELAHVVQQGAAARKDAPDAAPRLSRPTGGAGQAEKASPRRQTEPKVSRLFDGIRSEINKVARHIPGYTLLTVILGKNPITGDQVERNSENLVGGLIGLLPGGTMLYDRLKETRVLEEAFDWLNGQMGRLNITWARLMAAVDRARDLFSLWHPLDSIKPAFTSLYDDIVTFVGSLKDKVLELIVRGALRLAGPRAEQIWGIIQSAKGAIKLVLEDPLGFAKNLVRAISQGFGLFVGNAVSHLKKGLLGFLFGAMKGVELKLPERLDLKGIVSIVFQILGLTWANVRALLVKKLGPKAERAIAFVEKSVDVLVMLVKDGVLAVWQRLLAMIDNLRQTLLGGLTEFLTVGLIKGALSWLAGLTNPVGAIVKVALAIYEFITAFIERMDQILDLVQSIIGSLTDMALGKVDAAAKRIEEAIGQSVPLVLAFLAAIIPVSGITAKIQAIFKKLRAPVDKAVTKFVQFLVKKAKKLFARLTALLNRKQKMPKKSFRIGKSKHKLVAKKQGDKVVLFIRSREIEAMKAVAQVAKDPKEAKGVIPEAEQTEVTDFADEFRKSITAADKKGDAIKLKSKKESQSKPVADLDAVMEQAATAITEKGAKLEESKGVVTDDKAELLRFRVPISGFEGRAGTYSSLADAKSKEAVTPRVIELDHNPALSVLGRIRSWLQKLQEAPDAGGKVYFRAPKRGRNSGKAVGEAEFGTLSISPTDHPGGAFPSLAIYGPVNGKMAPKDKEQANEMGAFLEGKQVGDLDLIKEKLAKLMEAKLDTIKTSYSKEEKALVKNVGLGAQDIRKLAGEHLKLKPAKGAAEDRADVSNLTRQIALKGGGEAPDFTKAEGQVGSYGSVSAYSLRGYLEADHSPTNAEMEPSAKWTVGNFLPATEESRLCKTRAAVAAEAADEAVKGKVKAKHKVPKSADPATKARIAEGLARLKNLPVSEGRYSKSRGGAMVVTRDVNQNVDLKEQSKQLSEESLAAKVAVGWRDGEREALATKLLAGEDGAAAAQVKAAIRTPVHDAMVDRIKARQKKIHELYESVEKSAIRKANPAPPKGAADRAEAELAKIAATMKSAETTRKLSEPVDRWFKPG